MTKEELIDLVKIRLADKHASVAIEKALSVAWNTILYNTFRNNPDDLDLYSKEYFIETGDIETDTNTDIDYFELPVAVSQLPKSEQVRQVRPLQDTTNVFGIVSLSQRTTLSNLQSADINEKRTTCTVRGNRLEFENLSVAHKAAGVIAVLVIAFDEFDDTDDIYIPAGQDAQLLQLTSSYLEGMPPETKIDNNTDKQT